MICLVGRHYFDFDPYLRPQFSATRVDIECKCKTVRLVIDQTGLGFVAMVALEPAAEQRETSDLNLLEEVPL